MKGADVLLEAAHRPRPPRPAGAHRLRPRRVPRARRAVPRRPAVDCARPFEPDELDEVLADHDVLVLPSVMRESHSLVTREALPRGMPVVCTDTLGPEEVVRPRRQRPRRARRRRRRCWPPPSRASTTAGCSTDLRAGAADHPPCGRSTTRWTGSSDALRAPRWPTPSARAVRRHGAPTSTASLFVVRHRGRAAALPGPAAGRGAGAARRAHRRPPLPRPRSARPSAAQADVVVVYRVPGHAAGPRPDRRRCAAPARPSLFDVDDLIFDPDLADEIPALRLLPPDEADAVAARASRATAPRSRRATPTSAAPRGSSSTPRAWPGSRPPLRQRRRRGAGPPSDRDCAGPRRRDRRGSATSAAPPPTTTTGATSSRRSSRSSTRHPEVELWLGGHLTRRARSLDPLGDRVRAAPVHRRGSELPDRAPRPRRQPRAARPGQPVQRGQERDQVARGRPGRHPHRRQPVGPVP